VRLTYGELLVDQGWISPEVFDQARQWAARRGLFLIDKDGIVQHQLVNKLPLGRSIKEALRMVDALQHFEEHGEVCPMDWEKGVEAMRPTHESTASYLAKSGG